MAFLRSPYHEDNPTDILTKTNKLTRGSKYETVRNIEDTNNKWIASEQKNIDRMWENFRAFYDIDGGAWDSASLADLKSQGRHPTSINIAERKLQTLAGSIQSEKFDYDFLPLNLQESSLTKNIKHWYYADKEQYNYTFAENKTLLRGLIHAGDEEMEIRYDIRHTGAISFRSCFPGTVLKDPYWLSDDLKDWKRAIKHSWMTAQEILDYFEIDDPALQTLATQDATGGEWYEPRSNVDDLRNFSEGQMNKWGSKLLVIEYRWLEELKTTRLYGKLDTGNWIPFPLKIKENEVRKLKSLFGIESWENIKEFPYEDRVLRYSIICPNGTSMPIVENEEHPVQCGFIGFFRFSASKEVGIEKGIMEAILDLQRTLNYRESKKDDVIASAGVGATIVDIDRLDNQKADLDRIKKNKTKPDFVLGVHGNPNDIFGKMPTGDVPPDIWRDIQSLVGLFDIISPVTPAMEGSSRPDESGVLFQMRNAVTKLGTLMLYDNWQNYLMWKAEAWYNQAIRTYKGLYTKIPFSDKPGIAEFNKPMGDGTYLNSVDMLPRSKVIVTLSKSSPTQQMNERAMLFDMAKMLSANPQLVKPQLRITLNKLIETLELSPEQTMNYKMLNKMQEQIDIMEIFAQYETLANTVAQSKLGQEQAQMMLAQIKMQMSQMGQMQQPGQEQGGQGQQQVPESISAPNIQADSSAMAELPAPTQNEGEPGAPIETIRGPFQP